PQFQLVSIKMYFTTTPKDQIQLNSDWHEGDANPFSDSMSNVTIRDFSWVTDGNLAEAWWYDSGYTVMVSIQYHKNNESATYIKWTMLNAQTFDNYITSTAPTLTFNNNTLTIAPLVSGERIIEFRRTDIPYGGNTGITDEATLNEMLYTSLIDMEGSNPYIGFYYLSRTEKLYRWPPGNYTVGVDFRDSHNQARISAAINNALSEINSVMNEFGINFTRSGTSGDIDVIVDTEYNLFGVDIYEDSLIYGGTWATTKDNYGNITGATVKLASDFLDNGAFFISYEAAAFEELLQTMGAGHDQVEYPYQTIHTEVNYYNKASSMYSRDANILRLIYSDEVDAGELYYEVCKKLNIPKGVYIPSYSETNVTMNVNVLDFLERGGTYQVRAFIVNSSGNVSGTSDWLTIEVPEVSVEPWSWTASNGNATSTQTRNAYNAISNRGLLTDFSYLVWNDLVDKTKEAIEAHGGSWYTSGGGKTYLSYANTKMTTSNKNMTAARFNALRFNIGSRISTGITDRTTGDIINGSYFITLAQKLNDYIATL
uniref:hypothetical protein n=1 Tax=Pseudobutyrivibrio sp. TaxID=2014367 RepID=UPI0025D13408